MARKTPVSSSSDQLLDEFQALVRDTESLLQHSASLAGEQGEELREQIRNSLGRARSTLHNAEDPCRHAAKLLLMPPKAMCRLTRGKPSALPPPSVSCWAC